MTIINLFELRVGRRLPLLLQSEVTECGLACLAMVAGYHGYHSNLMELRARFNVSLRGATLNQIIQIAHELNLGTRAITLEIKDLVKLNLPCILHWNFNHFVVLKSVDGNRITLHDPAHGVRNSSIAEASKAFTGVALELWTDNGFKTQKNKPRISIRRMLGRTTGLYRSLSQIILLALALEVFALSSPFLLQWIIDDVLISQDRHLLATLLLGFGLLTLAQQAISGVRAWVMMHFSTVLNIQWKANVYSHLIRLPIQYFEKRHLGDVVSRFGSLDSIQQTLTAAFLSTIIDGFMTVATLGLMFVYSPILSCIALASVTLYTLCRWLWHRPLCNATEEQIVHTARQESHFLETIRGIRPLKLFRRHEERRSAWLSLLIDQINAGLRTEKLQLFYAQLNGALFSIESLLVLWCGAHMVMDNTFTVGILMAFIAYKSQFISRVASLVDHLFELQMLQLHGERLADIVMQPPEDTTLKMGKYDLRERNVRINIKGLQYRYSKQEPLVLRGIDLEINEGEFIALIGPSGSGKSTLLSLMIGILTPTQGQIQIGGIELSKLGTEGLRSLIGTVMQDDVLFAGSLAENISFFDQQADFSWIVKCAQMAAIDADIQSMPMSYNTLVGDMGTVLSGGQKQRILLARALYNKPRILFLDEATSHLDVDFERKVNDAISSLQITRVIIAHRPETIASADRVITLSQGEITCNETLHASQ
jgi:ATP-binding cassette, subfamily B, bacterial CvaB/MchF/RaxB